MSANFIMPANMAISFKKPIALAIGFLCGAGNEARTRYLHLGKVALYRMSYARVSKMYFTTNCPFVKHKYNFILPHPNM